MSWTCWCNCPIKKTGLLKSACVIKHFSIYRTECRNESITILGALFSYLSYIIVAVFGTPFLEGALSVQDNGANGSGGQNVDGVFPQPTFGFDMGYAFVMELRKLIKIRRYTA